MPRSRNVLCPFRLLPSAPSWREAVRSTRDAPRPADTKDTVGKEYGDLAANIGPTSEKPFTNTISNQSFNYSKESVFRQFRTSPASHSWALTCVRATLTHVSKPGPCQALGLNPAFPAHLRRRPVSRGNSRRATWVVPHAERPRFPGPHLL